MYVLVRMFRHSIQLGSQSYEDYKSYGEGVKKTKKKRSNNFKNQAIVFFKETSVTGIAAIIKSKGCCRKLMKIMILILGILGFLFHTFEFLKLYWEYSTISSLRRMVTIDKPAITICDENLIRRISFCQVKEDLCVDYGETMCTLFPAYCVDMDDLYTTAVSSDSYKIEYKDEYFELNFTRESGFQINENLLSCKWVHSDPSQKKTNGLSITNCSKPNFVRGLTRNKLPGACYSLGSTIGESNFSSGSLKLDAVLTLSLKWRSADLVDVVPELLSLDSPPLRVYYMSVHSPGELSNPFVEGFKIEERNVYKVQVSQVDSVRLPPPYSTNCYDYLSEWKANGGYGPLGREDCQKKCEIDENYVEYGCVPRDVSYPHEYPLCSERHSYNSHLKMKIIECSERCRDACVEASYRAESEVVGQISTEEAVKKYSTPSVVTVEFQFDILKSYVTKDKPKYESVELFSYIGGYLGMWLGWSLVAIFDFFEIVFHLIKYPFTMKRKKQNKKTHVRPVPDYYY